MLTRYQAFLRCNQRTLIILIAGFLMGGILLFPSLTDFLLVLNLLIPLYAFVIDIMRIREVKRPFVRMILILNTIGAGLLALNYFLILTGLQKIIEPENSIWQAEYIRPMLTYISTIMLISAHANLGNANANTDADPDSCK